MAQAPFFTGRSHENDQFNAETSVESRTPRLFGSLVDSYGTGYYPRPESGIKVFRNNNTPTTGLICGVSGDDILKSCARIIQDTLDDNNSETHIRSRVLVLHSGYGSISKPFPYSLSLPGMPQIKPHIYVPPISLDDIRNLYSKNVSLDYARNNIHPLVIHEDDISLRHLLAVLNPNGPPDSIWNLSFNRKLMQIVLSLPTKARYVDYTKAIVDFASWDPSEKEFLFARFKLFETFIADNALGRYLQSQPFLVVDLSHHLIQDAKIDTAVLDVVLNLFLSYRAEQRLIVCSGQHHYLSSDNVFKSTLWSMIETPFDSHTHLFFASQTPTLIPPDILSLLNCVVCHRFGSATWAAHLHAHFVHSAVPLEDYAPKLGSGEALLFAPEGASDDDGTLRRWNGGCVRLKVAPVKTRESEEAETTAGISTRPSITAPLDAWMATNGTSVLPQNLVPQPQPAPLRRAVTPQRGLSFRSPPFSFPHLDDDLNDLRAQGVASRSSSIHQTTPATVYQHPSPVPNLIEQLPRIPEIPMSIPPFARDTVPFIKGDQNDTTASTSLATVPIPPVSFQPNFTLSTTKTPNFEPFIAAIKRARRSNEKQIPRIDVGAHLSKADYESIGLIGLKQVVQAAVTAGVVVTGGGEYNAWVGLPEWFSPRFDDDLVTTKSTEPTPFNRPPGDIFAPLIAVLTFSHDHLKLDRPLIDRVVPALTKRHPNYLVNANCRSFFEYASLAEKEGIVVQGGTLEKEWIALKREGVELASPPMPTLKSPPGSVVVSRLPLPSSQPSVSTAPKHASHVAMDRALQRFAPLINAINRARKDEAPSVLWSKLGEALKKVDYVNMGVSGLKVCMAEAEKTGIIEAGKGVGLGQEWVALPEWSEKRWANIHAAIMKSRSSTPTPAVPIPTPTPTLSFSPNSAVPIVPPASSPPHGFSQSATNSSASVSTRFAPLIAAVEQCRQGDAVSVKCSLVGMNLTKEDYTFMGVMKWSQCLEAADKDGLIVRGGIGGDAWVALKSWQPDPLKVPAAVFSPLLQVLKSFRQAKGIADPYSQVIAKLVLKINANAFQQVGVPSFEEYTAIAEKQGFITVEGRGPSAKIRLKE